MSAFEFFTAWANAPFAVAAGIATAFALLQLSGVLGILAGGAHGGDHDADTDVDHDLEGEMGVQAAGDTSPGLDAHDAEWHDGFVAAGGAREIHIEIPAHRRPKGLARWLMPLGLGRLPLSMIASLYAFVFAVAGFCCNARALSTGVAPPVGSLALTAPLSATIAYVIVMVVARTLGPIFSSQGHEATSRADLVGQVGVVISTRVDTQFGEVRIRDRSGHDVHLVCKQAQGASRPVLAHQQVVVIDYDAERDEIFVDALEAETGRTE